MGHDSDPIWPYSYGGGDAEPGFFNPKILIDCAPTPLHQKYIRYVYAPLEHFRTSLIDARDRVDLRQGATCELFGKLRGEQARSPEEGSSTCNALIDALHFYMAQAGKIGHHDQLSFDFLLRAVRRPIVRYETTTLFHALLFPKCQGLLTEHEVEAYLNMPVKEVVNLKGKKNLPESFTSANLFHQAHERTIDGIVLIDEPDGIAPNPNRWRAWLSAKGPVLVRIVPDAAFFDHKGKSALEKYNENDIVFGSPGLPSTAQHAALLVGYTDKRRFILRNVWGPSWGEGGYAELSEDYARRAITESWGIHVDPMGRTLPLHDDSHGHAKT